MAKIPKVLNVADLSETNKDFGLLHFTKAQWTKAVRDISFTDRPLPLPKKGLVLRGIPDPNGNVVVFPGCSEQSPDTVCLVKSTFNGGTRTLSMECRCRSKPGPGHEGGGVAGGGGISPPECLLQVSRGMVQCANVSCQKTCSLQGASFGGQFLVFCACR